MKMIHFRMYMPKYLTLNIQAQGDSRQCHWVLIYIFDFCNDSVLIVIAEVFKDVLYAARKEEKEKAQPQAFDKRVRSIQNS